MVAEPGAPTDGAGMPAPVGDPVALAAGREDIAGPVPPGLRFVQPTAGIDEERRARERESGAKGRSSHWVPTVASAARVQSGIGGQRVVR